MKILFVGHEKDLNGASKSLLSIISMLEDNNSLYVLTAYKEGAFYDELKTHDVTILVYPYYRWCVNKTTKKNWLKKKILWHCFYKYINYMTAFVVTKLVRKEKIDIIHSNTSVVNVGALIKKLSGIKHIWHIREFADLDFEMYPLICQDKYYNFMNEYTDRFICVSDAIMQHYKQLSNEKKVVIYNGVDNDNIIRDRIYKKSGTINILLAGRISKAKGHQVALKACEYLVDEGICNFTLYLAGSGTLDFEIDERVKQHMKVLGYVHNMAEIRRDIDIELVCSVAEAFGRVTIEAMLGGIPVIGSASGGTKELIRDYENGFLFEEGNARDLSDKMKRLIVDYDLREQMGMSAQNYAMQNFLIERCVSEIQTTYDEVNL